MVADNASTDGSLDLVRRRRPDARLIEVGRNLGYSAGINAAVAAAAPSDAVLILNPDVRLARGSVATLAAGLREPGVGIAAPRVTGPDGALDHSLRRDPTVLRALGEALLGGRLAGRLVVAR